MDELAALDVLAHLPGNVVESEAKSRPTRSRAIGRQTSKRGRMKRTSADNAPSPVATSP